MKLSDATALYVGSAEISKVYIGSDEVWSKSGPTPGVLEGEITVGNYEGLLYGWSSGFDIPAFGAISGDASSHLDMFFFWGVFNSAATTKDITGAVLTFQGEAAVCEYDSDSGLYTFVFTGDTSAWPTSGTHKFWLLLPE